MSARPGDNAVQAWAATLLSTEREDMEDRGTGGKDTSEENTLGRAPQPKIREDDTLAQGKDTDQI